MHNGHSSSLILVPIESLYISDQYQPWSYLPYFMYHFNVIIIQQQAGRRLVRSLTNSIRHLFPRLHALIGLKPIHPSRPTFVMSRQPVDIII